MEATGYNKELFTLGVDSRGMTIVSKLNALKDSLEATRKEVDQSIDNDPHEDSNPGDI